MQRHVIVAEWIKCDGQQDALFVAGKEDIEHLSKPATQGAFAMLTTFREAVLNYLRSSNPARGTRAEYRTTITKWAQWGIDVPIE